MKKSPDHRLRDVKHAIETGEKPAGNVEEELFNLLCKKTAEPDVVSAHDIYASAYKREVMESFLLVGATATEVEDILKVPENITETYAHLFFDPDVFENELDRIDYAYSYNADAYGRNLKMFAVDLGKEALKIKMSRGTYSVNSTDVQNGIRSTAYLMGQMVRVNPMDSRIARESLRWAQLGLRAATEEDVDRATGGIDKVTFALDAKDETTNAEDSGIDHDEILH